MFLPGESHGQRSHGVAKSQKINFPGSWSKRFKPGSPLPLSQSALLLPFPAAQLSPFVELNQSFITFKLLDASIVTAFQTLGPWKSHFCWSRPSREQCFFTLSRSLEMHFQKPVPWVGDLSRSYPQSLSLMKLPEPGVCLEPENRNNCFPLVSNKEVGNRVLRLSYKILKANAQETI